jgi:hypothetical protein
MTLEVVLTAALDDEFHARATYRTVLDAFGDVRPFVNIVESEERHIPALGRLFERQGLSMPPDRWAPKASAPESLAAICEAALQVERGDGAGRGPRGPGRRRRRRPRGGSPPHVDGDEP